MAAKNNQAQTNNKKSRIYIATQDMNETDSYYGTPLRTCQVQTNTEVEVPADVREVYDLARMQQMSTKNTIDSLRLKDKN